MFTILRISALTLPSGLLFMHDGHPTACVADAAFGYVNAFKAHVNVGFFRGAEIADPEGLLEGTGKSCAM